MNVRKYNQRERYEKMQEMYKDGYEISEICVELEYKDPKHIIRVLKMLGVYEEESSDIDVPKVLSLQKAGWTMDMIEQEFNYRFSAEQISDAVSHYGRKNNGKRRLSAERS